MGEYNFLQLTKRAKSIKELQEMGLSENTKHATNFMALKQDTFEAVRLRGVNLVNSYQNKKSNTDVKAVFLKKYLLSLKDILVIVVYVSRSASSMAYSHRAHFQSKMNRSFLGAGGRC